MSFLDRLSCRAQSECSALLERTLQVTKNAYEFLNPRVKLNSSSYASIHRASKGHGLLRIQISGSSQEYGLKAPSTADKILKLRKSLGISQTEFGKRLGASTMGVSRWERGEEQPEGSMLLNLGILAGKDARLCWDFWNLAGLSTRDVVRVLPNTEKRFGPVIPVLQVSVRGKRHKPIDSDLVAIPFLSVFAAAGKQQGSLDDDLKRAPSEQFIAAPRLWCPNPTDTFCMRVKGNSMEPVLFNGYIIVADQKQSDRKKLGGKVVVAKHKKFGLVVSRYWRLNDSEALISDNRIHDPVPLTSEWALVGKVLWWIGEEF
jgi:DNA-binding transcriptional regulator YiaG